MLLAANRHARNNDSSLSRKTKHAEINDMNAAFFDMDKTVLRIDTLRSWIAYQRESGEISTIDLMRGMYWGILYRLALTSFDAMENSFSTLAGESEYDLTQKGKRWFQECVEHEISSDAIKAIEHHRQRREKIVLITGSTQYTPEALSAMLNIDHTLCSRLEVVDGKFTGRLESRCYGEHKVTAAEEFAQLHGIDLDKSTFYSDSYLDLPMLNRVNTPVVVNPDWRLKRHAKKAGWQTEYWS